MAKSLGYYTYTGAQSIASGSTLPLVNTVRQYGNNVRLRNGAVALVSSCGCSGSSERAAGYYTAAVNTSLTASAAGTVTVSLYQDGQLVPGATQSVTAAASDIVSLSFSAPVRVFCGTSQSNLTLVVSGQTVTTVNVAIEVIRE